MLRIVICRRCVYRFQNIDQTSCMLPFCFYEQHVKEMNMPSKSLHFCNHFGCSELTNQRYCPGHMAEHEEQRRDANARFDKNRGSAQDRGYDGRWQKYSKAFLSRPENQICRLHLDAGCAVVSQCVDHINPPDGPDDPRFWDKSNHQSACLHCNTVKGHRYLKGTYDMMSEIDGNLSKRK